MEDDLVFHTLIQIPVSAVDVLQFLETLGRVRKEKSNHLKNENMDLLRCVRERLNKGGNVLEMWFKKVQ